MKSRFKEFWDFTKYEIATRKAQKKSFKAEMKRLKSLPMPELEGIALFKNYYRNKATVDGHTDTLVGIMVNDQIRYGVIMNPFKCKKGLAIKCVGFVKSNDVDPSSGSPLYKLYIIDGSYEG